MYQTGLSETAVIVGAYTLCRLALRKVLESETGVRVIGEAATPLELVDLLRSCEPNIVVLEQSLPQCSATEALVNLNRLDRLPRLVILIEEAEAHLLSQSSAVSSAMLISKSMQPVRLIECIRELTERSASIGKLRRSTMGAKRPAQECDARPDRLQDGPGFLSAIEFGIVEELARGAPNKRIANNLGIAEQTVKNHLTSLYRRFRVRNRLELLMSPGLRTVQAMSRQTALLQKGAGRCDSAHPRQEIPKINSDH